MAQRAPRKNPAKQSSRKSPAKKSPRKSPGKKSPRNSPAEKLMESLDILNLQPLPDPFRTVIGSEASLLTFADVFDSDLSRDDPNTLILVTWRFISSLGYIGRDALLLSKLKSSSLMCMSLPETFQDKRAEEIFIDFFFARADPGFGHRTLLEFCNLDSGGVGNFKSGSRRTAAALPGRLARRRRSLLPELLQRGPLLRGATRPHVHALQPLIRSEALG